MDISSKKFTSKICLTTVHFTRIEYLPPHTMKKHFFIITALVTIFFVSACTRPGWGKFEDTNAACFAAREKFMARDMDGVLQILAPHDHPNRTPIQTTLSEAKIELAKLSEAELGDSVNAVVTIPTSPNTSFHIGMDGIHFNQGTSVASTKFKYKHYEVVFACNFEHNYGVWTTKNINWSAKKL